jgi:hypothetical protein
MVGGHHALPASTPNRPGSDSTSKLGSAHSPAAFRDRNNARWAYRSGGETALIPLAGFSLLCSVAVVPGCGGSQGRAPFLQSKTG